MYTDDDPHLAEVRRVCLALPETAEVEAWGRPTFRAGKRMFAIFEGDEEHPFALVFKPEPAEREALLAEDRFYSPAYHGPYGWLGLDLVHATPDWEEITELVDGSYRQVAIKRMLVALDG